ncbi:MAG: tRNA pseudouridine(13) synthase TruD, partial [Proteobacteria bacterium]|nr:tRNA pseudouridine(13) synthase TruD [Pseudomonadota bacterium]
MSDAENCAAAEIRARQVALHPPRAYGEPLAQARARLSPEDFQVDELLSFEPSDAGPHWLLRVEKREVNTRWVAAELARLGGVPPAEVGYAGLKDRHALTRQWFSVPAARREAEFWRQVSAPQYQVLEVRANQRKLRRGALRGNRFRIRLQAPAWPQQALRQRLDALRAQGAPNYFGVQRF